MRNKILVLVLLLLCLAPLGNAAKEKDPVDRQMERVRAIYDLVKNNYVKEPADDALFESALKGMVSGLDPYSEYFTAEEYNNFMVDTKGEFGGVGMEISMEDGVLTVVTPLEDSPAFRAGIMAGDRILEIGGDSTEGMSVTESIKRVRGKPGTQVVLTVLHKGEVATEKITITREIIKINSIKGARIIDEDDKIGYLRLTAFQEDTMEMFDRAVEKLQKQGMKSLIMDLRYNPGGLLDTAIRLSNRFLKEGIIISVRGRRKEEVSTISATPEDATLAELPLVILINGSSASASEVFSGAMQDYKRAKLVGMRSYGKGSVQTVFPIKENGKDTGAAVKMTIAKYFTPSGRSLDRDKDKKNFGLEPDVLVEMTTEQEVALIKARQKERLIKPVTPVEEVTTAHPKPVAAEDDEPVDIQLDKALEILRDEAEKG